jgi:hypothetical protein
MGHSDALTVNDHGGEKEYNYLKVIRQFHDQYRVNVLPEIRVNENTLHTYTRIQV